MSFDIQTLSLSEICTDISYGYTASANTEIVGPKFLRITDIQGGVVDWDTVPYCEIPESKLNKNLLSQGDIVVARTGNSTGENYMFSGDEPSVFASYLIRFKVDSNIANPHYVWLQMRTKRWWDFVSGAKSGSAQAGANATVLGKFEVTLPPKNVQDYVVDVISCLSSKISLNTSTNQTLEEMAQAIFKSWFVDFDPVKAKMNGEPPEGMDEATAALFPDKLVESELGLIPEGWNVRCLEEVAEFQNGFAFYTTGYSDEGFSVVDLGNISTEGKFIQTSHDKYISEEIYHLPKHKKHHLNKDDLVMAMTDMTQAMGILGKTGKITESNKYILNQRIGRIRCKSNIDVNFMLTNLNSRHQLQFLKVRALGTVQKYVNTNHIKEMEFIIPCDDLMQKFGDLVRPLFDRIYANDLQNMELAKLRDTLLPKLLSGEIELNQTEELAEVVYE